MAHFAQLDNNNIVQQVIVIGNEDCGGGEFPASEAVGQLFISSLGFDGIWKQTSYNNNFRKQYAGVGYKYLDAHDVFVAPQPYPSWTLDANHDWQAPTPKPEGSFVWDEETLAWVEVPAGS